jgi:Uncharacterized conserved protein (DUF2340)
MTIPADTLKLYTKAHGAKVSLFVLLTINRQTASPFSPITFKTTNLIINLNNDDWILDDDSQILADIGFGALLRPLSKLSDLRPSRK